MNIIKSTPYLNYSLGRQLCPMALNIRTMKSNKIVDVCTHTGQKWDSNDYRLARFNLAPKLFNKSWSVNLIAEIPPREIPDRVVWCDGGGGAEGHPRIYINLDKPGPNTCGYCGLRFVKKDLH